MNSVFSRSRSARRRSRLAAQGMAKTEANVARLRIYVWKQKIHKNTLSRWGCPRKTMHVESVWILGNINRMKGNWQFQPTFCHSKASKTSNPKTTNMLPLAFEVRDISLSLRLVQVTKFLSQKNWREEKRQHHFTIKKRPFAEIHYKVVVIFFLLILLHIFFVKFHFFCQNPSNSKTIIESPWDSQQTWCRAVAHLGTVVTNPKYCFTFWDPMNHVCIWKYGYQVLHVLIIQCNIL